MKRILLIPLVILMSSCITKQTKTTDYGVKIPIEFSSKIDVIYKETDNWTGKMDLYLPPNRGKSTPILINIHGGGWNHGSKEKQTDFQLFFKENIAVANINYRLVDIAPAPAAIEDVRSAIIYLIKNAEHLNIDVKKIIIMGGSSGGHLALCAGYIANNPIFDSNREEIKEVKVAAIINKYGIADLFSFSIDTKKHNSAIRWLGENINNMDFKKSVSGITYIDEDSPPTFIIHGDADPIVPYIQSVKLHKTLVMNGIESEFITIKNGGHGKFTKKENSKINKAIIKFLKKVVL